MQTKKELLSKSKLDFYNEIKKYQLSLKPTKEIDGFGSSAIVGEKNYPFLKIHNVSNSDRKNSYDKSSEVVRQNYSEIFKLKAKNILASGEQTYVKNVDERLKKEISDIYKSKNIVEFTTTFDNELKFNKPILSKSLGSCGTSNSVKNIYINENTKTSKKIEKFTEGDVKSTEAIIDLYEKGFSEHQIINILALGEFGISHNKKLVPTRWAITAYDSSISKYLYKKIVKYNPMNYYEIFYYSDKGNSFVVLILPDTFSFENFEFTPSGWNAVDYVGYDNKLGYLEPNTAGGFFASKVAVFEYLEKKKRQASILVLREIDNYDIPLGVVFVRECVRDAVFKKSIFKTSSKKEFEEFLRENFNSHYLQYLKSKTVFEIKNQRKINDWM